MNITEMKKYDYQEKEQYIKQKELIRKEIIKMRT